MKISQNIDYVCDHILKPWSRNYTTKEKALSWAITILGGIYSFGLLQGVTFVAKAINSCVKSKKSTKVFQKNIKSSFHGLNNKLAKLSLEEQKSHQVEYKIEAEREALRNEIKSKRSMTSNEAKKIGAKSHQLFKAIGKTEKLHERKNEILQLLDLPVEAPLQHPYILSFNTIDQLSFLHKEIIKKLDEGNYPNKEEVQEILRSLGDDIKQVGDCIIKLKLPTNQGNYKKLCEKAEPIIFEINVMIDKLQKISNSL